MPSEMIHQSRGTSISLAALGLLAIIALLLPAFPQDSAYHQFAAQLTIVGIPNFWNVISNLPFLLVAILPLFASSDSKRNISTASFIFHGGVFLTGLGSAYYHWLPTTDRLFWDRLPMTIAFSGVISAIIQRRYSEKIGAALLWPTLVLSVASVFYWRWTESQGHSNLTPYGIVQFGTVAFLLFALLFRRRKNAEQRLLRYAAAAYLAAKLLEAYDRSIADHLHIIGGHPLKHIAAALACYLLHRALFSKEEPLRSQ